VLICYCKQQKQLYCYKQATSQSDPFFLSESQLCIAIVIIFRKIRQSEHPQEIDVWIQHTVITSSLWATLGTLSVGKWTQVQWICSSCPSRYVVHSPSPHPQNSKYDIFRQKPMITCTLISTQAHQLGLTSTLHPVPVPPQQPHPVPTATSTPQ
jgi:hypothetical protein